MKNVLVCGSGGFIGGHLTKKLKSLGCNVTGIDLKHNEFQNDHSDNFIKADLRNPEICKEVCEGKDTIFQLAADMGGAGYIFTGDNDADVMHNSATINLNILNASKNSGVQKIFYSSSACVYPEFNQMDSNKPVCSEESVYPAQPDSEYGWEKLFSERLYEAYYRNHGLEVRVARFHNIFGPKGTWKGGKEKAPAAICRKVAECNNGDAIEIWGTGTQTRSFLFIDECVEAILRLVESDFRGPVNIGSEEMISINNFAEMVIDISGKNVSIKNIEGPTGVNGRNSDNRLIKEKLNWAPSLPLKKGVELTYNWISSQISIES